MTERFDHHFFFHHDSGDTRADRESILHILARLSNLEGQVHRMAKTESDLQTDMDAIKTAVGDVLTKQTAQAATIADLKAQLAAGTPVSQQQLEDLDAEAQAIVASLTPLAAPPATT